MLTMAQPGCNCDEVAGQALSSVEHAVSETMALCSPISDVERVPLHDANTRVLAADILASGPMPRFDNSAMDGYALLRSDADQGRLPVDGVAAAGDPISTIVPGHAMRIYTGAPVPIGADTVVMQEHVRTEGGTLYIDPIPPQFANIRSKGGERSAGDLLLARGARITSRHLGVIASNGQDQVGVFRKPRVAILLTGAELVPVGQPLKDGEIWDVNAPVLAAQIVADGAELVSVQHVTDNSAAMEKALSDLANMVDVIVTSAGISVGDRDFVAPALQALGAHTTVSGVAIKPGKPFTASRLGATLVISLPGNPMSALITWLVLARPALAKLSGETFTSQLQKVVLSAPLSHKVGRRELRPATLEGFAPSGLRLVSGASATHSAYMSPLAEADGMVILSENTATFAAGDCVDFLPF